MTTTSSQSIPRSYFGPIDVPATSPHAQQVSCHNPEVEQHQPHPQVVVTTHQSQPPNYLRVKNIPSLSSKIFSTNNKEATFLDTPASIEENEEYHLKKNHAFNGKLRGKEESNLFETLKILRDAKNIKKKRNFDEKYKRFSMNNFEEFRTSMLDIIDFSLFKKSESEKKTSQLSESIHIKNEIEVENVKCS